MQKEVGTHALHVQCAWRIRGPEKVLVDSSDRYQIMDGGRDWDRVGANLCDVRVRQFVESECPSRVTSVHADDLGTLTIELERGHTVDVFPDEPADQEQWRFFSPYQDGPHSVFASGTLIEE